MRQSEGRVGAASRGTIHIGTSGWTYEDWSGPFYPEGVKGPERLSFYAKRFSTVEVNASFYRFPTGPMVAAWNRRLTRGFHLVLKGHRQITHRRQLKECDETLAAFLEKVLPLRTLRVLLWQLPPSFHRDTGRLEEFLTLLPVVFRQAGASRRHIRHAVEFRHESWWDDETAELLNRHKTAFVTVSHPRLPEDIVPTTDFLYVRFHGKGPQLYDYDYSEAELSRWCEKLEPHLGNGSLYAFFNNDWHANAPRNALRFRDLLLTGIE